MKRFVSLSLTILMTLCLIISSERRAWGYVDPGSGLIALQTFASVAAAYLYVARNRVRAFFSRKKQAESAVLPASKATGSEEVA